MSWDRPYVETNPFEGLEDDPFHWRGVGYALWMIPLTVAVWFFFWQLGVITSFIPLLAAIGAVMLYRYGSRGDLAARGMVAITLIVLSAVTLSLTVTLLFDAYLAYPQAQTATGVVPFLSIFGDVVFWEWFWQLFVVYSTTWEAWIPNIVASLVVTVFGLIPALSLSYFGARDRVSTNVVFVTVSVVLGITGYLTFVIGPWRLDLPPSAMELAADAEPRAVGDCLAEPTADLVSESYAAIPVAVACDQLHWGEVIFVGPLDAAVAPSGDPAEYPTEYPTADWFTEQAGVLCQQPFAELIGIPYEQSTLEQQIYFPSVTSWAAGDREVLCLVQEAGGVLTTGSLFGSAR